MAMACMTVAAQQKVKVSCVGNSVTYGMTLPDRETTCYPNQLQLMLGDGYEVRNFGHSGATLMRNGHNPYNKLPEYRDALDFAGDIVVIHLGLNDTDPRNWPQRGEEFIPDYRMLIDSLRAVNPSCKVYVCQMTPIFQGHPRFLSGTRDWHAEIQKAIRTVAEGAGAQLIDLYTPLHNYPNYFPDNLHPYPKGARIIAETVFAAITGNRFQPLSLPDVYQNGMVLQREAENVVSGRSAAGDEVKMEFNGKKLKAKADKDGHWSITLPAMKAGGPYRMQLSAKPAKGVEVPKGVGKTLAIDSIYIGEVWLCSGQSNMEWVNGNLPEDMRPEICRTGQADEVDNRLHLYRMEGLRTITSDEPWTAEQLEATNDLHFIKAAHWTGATRETVTRFSSIAYRVGRALADSLGCHVGLVANAIGGSNLESWVDRTTMEYDFPAIIINARPAKSDFLMDWVRKCIAINTQASTDNLQRHPFDPCYLYENSIMPLEGLTFRGVMWYQGESNAHNLDSYAALWPAMTRQWRKVLRSADGGELPFYTCQLSAISGRPSWGRFRDMQRRLADADERTYLVVSHDVGEQWNVHPSRKGVQASRLAGCILHHEYGCSTPADSPVLVEVSVNKGTVTLTFNEKLAADATSASYPVDLPSVKGDWFEMAGRDGLFYPATASVHGNTVTLFCPQIDNPVKVRYAWRDFTRATLCGSDTGLPVSSFTQGF